MHTSKANLRYDDYINGIKGLQPEEQLSLIEVLSTQLKKNLAKEKKRHSIMELEGLGAEVWKGIEAQKYVKSERKSWE